MKTGIRLTQIDKMITSHYQEIWDCCCDHGLLGLTLLKRKAADVVHFVDVVEPLMVKLESTLQQFFSDDNYRNKWQVHCLDVAKLPVTSIATKLVIIAGVGGELLIELMTEIINKTQTFHTGKQGTELEFILCPVHYQYKVRQSLIELNCHLINECLVSENNRFYEIIHVSVMIDNKTRSTAKESVNKDIERISPVGSLMWDLSHKMHQQYLTKTIKHYQRMSNNPEMDVVEIIAAYQTLAKQC